MAVPKNPVSRDNGKATDELEANIVCDESRALQSGASAVVLEETGIIEGTGTDLPDNPTELTAITLYQPWASLIAKGCKQYETRDWPTNHRGLIVIHAGRKPKGKQELREHDKILASFNDLLTEDCPYSSVIAIAELTDVILMTDEIIGQQTETELRCGNWAVGRYAFKLENVRAIEPMAATGKQGLWKWKIDSESGKCDDGELEKDSRVLALRRHFLELFFVHKDASAISKSDELEPWNPADFGEVQHKAGADGQLNLLEFDSNEPPEPDDYPGDLEAFKKAYLAWAKLQEGIEEEYQRITAEEIWNQSSNGNGSICVQESGQGSPTQELNCGDDRLIYSVSETNIADESLTSDSPADQLPQTLSEVIGDSLTQQILSPPHHPANHSQPKENVSEPKTIETVSQQSLLQLESYNQNLQLSKTSLDFSTALSDQEAINSISPESLSIFPRAGTMQNGNVSAQDILPAPGVGSDSLLLRSPGALSGSESSRPPGKNKLETQLNQLELIQDGEVAAPEFLEVGFDLPTGWTNPQEKRTALELAQVQAQQSSIVLKSELPAETETTETDEEPLEMRSTGELQALGLSELNISVTLPPNIGALRKDELISMAGEQHQFISRIERKEFELALEKLYRARLTGVYLQEFKKKCQHGEFQNQLKQAGIGERSAQNYMAIAKDWEVIESKAQFVALLSEDNERPSLTINWALQAVRDEKKQLKSAAPPKDPDNWKTPENKEQPIVSLVKKALGGQIYLDPCSDSGCNIPATMRYFKWNDGLASHNIWQKTVFINPPFSDPFPWVKRTCLEIARGSVSAAVMLLKAGVISNVGTGELINKYASAICHWRGRINFLNDEGNPVKGSDFDCVFIYFGSRLDLFRGAFGGRGTIATIENHYSSVNKKFMTKGEKAEFGNVEQEQKQLAAAVGLGNGRSVLPDMRDADRERNERYDPHTVVDVLSSSMPTTPAKPVPVSENLVEPLAEPEIFDETPLATRQFETAKQNTLNDYITAISSNLSDFSDEQIAFLVKIVNEESVKRIGF
jgi:hypothetical protein